MELHQLKLFNAIAQHKSCTKAAQILHLSQPALSMQVKKLEQDLDMKLFDKIGNRMVLNQNGELLYQYTLQIFQLIEQAEHELLNLKGFIGGSLTIGGSNTIGTYILPKIIGSFKKLYPHLKVNLHIANTDEIAQLVEKGTLDFALNGGNMTYSDHVQVKYMMSDQLIVAASPDNQLVKKRGLKFEDFKDQEFIAHETHSQLYKYVENFMEKAVINGRITYSLGNISAIKQAVAANLGISLIPYSAVTQELINGSIIALSVEGSRLEYPYNLIVNKDKYQSPAAKKLMAFIEAQIHSKPIDGKDLSSYT